MAYFLYSGDIRAGGGVSPRKGGGLRFNLGIVSHTHFSLPIILPIVC